MYRANGHITEQRWRIYPDGMPLFDAPLAPPEVVLLRPSSLADFFTALCWFDALKVRGMPTPSLILPCVPGARQDRVNSSGDYLCTLKTVADAINAREFPSVTVFDPHSDVTPALIDRCRVAPPVVPVPTRYAGVIAPDGGAEKRALKVAKALDVPLVHAWKSRNVATGQLTGFGIESLNTGHCLIVDDLCDAGGTFLGLADVLDGVGVTADLFVTHGLFTKGTTQLLRRFHRVTCTDSTLGDKPGVTVIPACIDLLTQYP